MLSPLPASMCVLPCGGCGVSVARLSTWHGNIVAWLDRESQARWRRVQTPTQEYVISIIGSHDKSGTYAPSSAIHVSNSVNSPYMAWCEASNCSTRALTTSACEYLQNASPPATPC